MSDAQEMAQMQAMMQAMGGGHGAKPRAKDNGGVSWESGDDEKFFHQYLDARYFPRFGEGTFRKMGALRSGGPVHFDRGGRDPFQKYLHESTKKKEPIDFERVTTSLFSLPAENKNFSPLKEVLTHPHWNDSDKVRVMSEVLEYHQNADLPDPGSGKSALYYAFQLKDHKARLAAVNMLVQHGVELNKPDLHGRTPMHEALEYGCSDVIPLMVSYGGKFTLTGRGQSLGDIAMNHFKETLRNPGLSQQAFEDNLTEYYKSLAQIKKYKLHKGAFDFSEHKKELQSICKEYPGYGPFVDTMELELGKIQPLEQRGKEEKPRAFTNPGWGLNEPIANTYQHPWLKMLSVMDRMNDKLERKIVIQESDKRVRACLNGLDDLTEPAVLTWLKKDRKTFSLDYKIRDLKLNPNDDTLLTKCIREGRYEAAQNLIGLNVDLHAKDGKGNTALHLLAATCNDKEQFLLTIKQLIGVPGEKGRVPLLGENIADWNIRDANGGTFVDILRKTHPEWIEDLVQQTGIQPRDESIPEWSPSHILMLGGPEEVLRLSKNPDLLQLEDKTIPVLEPVNPLATKEEKHEHTMLLCSIIERVQRFKTDASPAQQNELNRTLADILLKQTPETKMQALVAFAVNMDHLDSNKIRAQDAILKSVVNTMANGTTDEKRNIFDVFDAAGQEAQFNIVNMLESQSVLMVSELKDAPPEEQARIGAAIEEFKQSASAFSRSMSQEAQSKYGIVIDNVVDENKPEQGKNN